MNFHTDARRKQGKGNVPEYVSKREEANFWIIEIVINDYEYAKNVFKKLLKNIDINEPRDLGSDTKIII